MEKLDIVNSHLLAVRTDITEMKSDVLDIKVTMGINTKSLEYHIQRTDDLQKMVEEFKKHMLLINTIIKVVAGLGGILVFLNELGILDKLFRAIN